MGGAKAGVAGWNWTQVSELLGAEPSLLNVGSPQINTDVALKTGVYKQFKDISEAGVGFDGVMEQQLKELLRVRALSGGWDNFVAKALATGEDVLDADSMLLAQFLERTY
jgi:hypothetical protein